MSAVEGLVGRAAGGRLCSARAFFATTRFWIYLSCTALAVLANYLLGKEMMFDTLGYHLYAGFSALYDRFASDYFPAGTQSYLNPYVYVPFYALAKTGIPALWVTSAFALVQSGILWLTYEIAVAVSPSDNSGARVVAGACAAVLALLNPILINQLGSSYADITTAEIVLAGWLLLVHALRAPSAWRIVGAGLLLGAASALKLTNSLHAICAGVLLLFLPASWRRKTGLCLGFIAAVAVSVAAVAAPWGMRLEQHFGNPFFPLMNGVFRSPYYPPVSLADYRFVPGSFAQAFWRPFAITLPITFVDDEFPSPDLRYALLLILALVAVALWGWRRFRRAPESSSGREEAAAGRAFAALGCAFLVDWVLWLRASGNGRYFMAMACVAAVLSVVLAFRIFAARPRVLAGLLLAVIAVQAVQLAFGAGYRPAVQWDGRAWIDVSVPPALKQNPDLYFLIGEGSESFIAPFVAKGSAFVNLDGDYVLGPDGINGARVQSLIRQYASHIRVVAIAGEFHLTPVKEMPELSHVNDTLASFGLRADSGDCGTITLRDMRARLRKVLPGTLPINIPQLKDRVLWVPQARDGYVVECGVVPDPAARAALANAEREPNLVFDRMERECPRLFQPPRPVTKVYDDGHGGHLWVRGYPITNLSALISDGSLRLADGNRGGPPDMLGSESDWAKAPVPLACGQHGEHFYAKAVSSTH
jgi:hypothetical protein